MYTGNITPQEKKEIFLKVGKALLECPTEEWGALVYKWNGLEGYSTDGLYLYREEREGKLIETPTSIIFDIDRLRAGMYTQGRGTWFSMHYTITPPAHYDVTFNYDDPPDFLIPASPHAYVDDLEYFPRDPEHIPTWLQQKIDEAKNDT